MTKRLIEKFLTLVSENGGNVTHACDDLGISRTAIYVKKRDDPEFAIALGEAQDRGIDVLEDEAKERALNGCIKPIYYQGEIVGSVREKSDTLMKFLLRAHRHKYRNVQELTGPDGKPLNLGGTSVNIVTELPDNGRKDKD